MTAYRVKTMKGEAVDHQDAFTTETAGLPEASSPSVVRLYDGDSFELRIHPVRKRIGDAVVRMLGYNGSIPGPTLHVDQGSQITVQATNDGDVETTIHWHGLRLENRYDGVPEETQALIPPGGTFTYKLKFPDYGFYWYHPHFREDFAFGVLLVVSLGALLWLLRGARSWTSIAGSLLSPLRFVSPVPQPPRGPVLPVLGVFRL